MGRVVGQWSWVLLLWRPGLSNWNTLYKFVLPQSSRPSYAPGCAKEELMLLVLCLPFTWADLSRCWLHLLGATDAST